MRHSYGISAWSLAVQTFKKLLAWATLAGAAAYGLLTLITPASAAAQPEAAAAGAATAEPAIVPSPLGVDIRLFTILALAVLLVLYVVVRRMLAPVARGFHPFGPSHPGM